MTAAEPEYMGRIREWLKCSCGEMVWQDATWNDPVDNFVDAETWTCKNCGAVYILRVVIERVNP